MEEFKKILYPVDLSEVSSKILPYVVTMANKFDAEIHVLFVITSLEHYATFYVPHPSLNQFEQELTRGAGQKLQEFANEFLADYPSARVEVLHGDPAEEIVKYVESHKIDLIVMGTHGRKGFEKAIFGSVADRVVKRSPVPVMTINPHTTN